MKKKNIFPLHINVPITEPNLQANYEQYPPEIVSVSPKLRTNTDIPSSGIKNSVAYKNASDVQYQPIPNYEGRVSHIKKFKKPERISKNSEARL